MKKNKGFLLLVGLLVVMALFVGCLAQKTTIKSIILEPAKYDNELVSVSGLVVNPTPQPPGTTRGYYSLQDDDGNEIIIKTKKLPAPSTQVSVTGYVNVSPVDGSIVIKEETSPMLIYAGLALIVLILLVILIWKLISPPPTQPGIYVGPYDDRTIQTPFRITLSPESGLQNALPAYILGIPRDNQMTVGTNNNCFIRIVEPQGLKTISGLHARLSLDPQSNEIKIMSLADAVTKVNDDVVRNGETHILKSNDRLTLGNVVIRFIY